MGRAEERRKRAKAPNPIRRATAVTLLCLALGGGALLATGQPAKADNRIHVTGTSEGLALRTDPSTNGGVHWYLKDGETANFKCYVHGEYVDGVNHTDVWFKVWYPRQDGSFQEGYISAAYTTVTSADLANLTGSWDISECGGAPTPPPVRHEPSGQRIDANGYNRFEAINWALQHAQDAQPKWGGCTWFVSQALWAGGMQQIRGEWTDDDRKPTQTDGALSNWVPKTGNSVLAAKLWEYLPQRASVTVRELDFLANSVPDAALGDIIAYDWGEGEDISHLTMVTSIAPNQYPEVSEWGATNNTPTSQYRKRGWTWSENAGNWLQTRYPHVKAYLMHFNN